MQGRSANVAVAFAAGFGIFLGTILGSAIAREERTALPAPEPSPVVTVYRNKTVVSEVQIPASLPQSCVDLPKSVKDLTANLNDLDTAAGLLKAQVVDIETYAMTADSVRLVESINAVNKTVKSLDAATVAKLDYAEKFKLALERCQSDLG